jgi:hypothetical protein
LELLASLTSLVVSTTTVLAAVAAIALVAVMAVVATLPRVLVVDATANVRESGAVPTTPPKPIPLRAIRRRLVPRRTRTDRLCMLCRRRRHLLVASAALQG